MIIETWLVSRELAEMAGDWDARLSADDDGEYFCRLLRFANGVKFVPEAVSYYRASGSGSLSSVTLSPEKLRSQFRSICVHIETLLALADNERTRAACVSFLQRWLIYFYPEQKEILAQAMEMASSLGGSLQMPALPLKYELIRRAFGWETAKVAMFKLPNLRSDLARRRDSFASKFQRREV
jgi:hypothetical protein